MFQQLHWHTIENGSRSYIDAFQKTLPSNHHIHLNETIDGMKRQTDGRVEISHGGGKTQFDHVVLAVHANQALTILGDEATMLEQSILSKFHTSSNICILHSDTSAS